MLKSERGDSHRLIGEAALLHALLASGGGSDCLQSTTSFITRYRR